MRIGAVTVGVTDQICCERTLEIYSSSYCVMMVADNFAHCFLLLGGTSAELLVLHEKAFDGYKSWLAGALVFCGKTLSD